MTRDRIHGEHNVEWNTSNGRVYATKKNGKRIYEVGVVYRDGLVALHNLTGGGFTRERVENLTIVEGYENVFTARVAKFAANYADAAAAANS